MVVLVPVSEPARAGRPFPETPERMSRVGSYPHSGSLGTDRIVFVCICRVYRITESVCAL